MGFVQARAASKDQKGSDATKVVHDVPQPAASAAHGLSNGKRAPVTAMPAAADELSHKAKKHKASAASLGAATSASTVAVLSENEDLAVANGNGTAGEATTGLDREQRMDKVKWKKLAAQILKEHKGGLKLSKLQKQLRLAAHVGDDHAADADAIIQSRLKGSSQFLMKGKSVVLASA